MSHFYSRIEGTRGPATRCGTKQAGVDDTFYDACEAELRRALS